MPATASTSASGDPDFEGYWNGAFGTADVDDMWISDFDNGTAFRDGSCNVAIFEGAGTSTIFGKPVFTSDKYRNTGIGAFEGIGGGGDSFGWGRQGRPRLRPCRAHGISDADLTPGSPWASRPPVDPVATPSLCTGHRGRRQDQGEPRCPRPSLN